MNFCTYLFHMMIIHPFIKQFTMLIQCLLIFMFHSKITHFSTISTHIK